MFEDLLVLEQVNTCISFSCPMIFVNQRIEITHISVHLFSGMLPEAVLPPHKDHEYAQWKHVTQHIPNSLQPSPLKKFTPASVKKISDTTSEGMWYM